MTADHVATFQLARDHTPALLAAAVDLLPADVIGEPYVVPEHSTADFIMYAVRVL